MVLAKATRLDLKGELRLILLRHQGCDQVITGMEMAQVFRYHDDRPIRLAIRELIKDGLPVASSGQGYFLPANKQEADRYAESLKGRLIEDALRRRDFRRAADSYLKKVTQGRMF